MIVFLLILLARFGASVLIYILYKRNKNRIIKFITGLLTNLKIFSYEPRKLKNLISFILNNGIIILQLAVSLLYISKSFDNLFVPIFIILNQFLLVAIAFKTIALAALLAEQFLLEISVKWDIEPSELKSFRTILPLAIGAIKSLLNIVLALAAVTILGVDISPFLNFGLVITAVLGYAFQPLILDYLSLFKILTESLYEEGDLITFILLDNDEGSNTTGYFSGRVLKISPNFTYIKTEAGEVTSLSNRLIDCVIRHPEPESDSNSAEV